MTRRRPIVSRVIPEDAIETALRQKWPGTWPAASPLLRQFIVTFAKECVVFAEDEILNRVDIPRWSEFDRETQH